MTSVMILAAFGLCLLSLLWKRYHRTSLPASPGALSRETLALQAFAHGNRRLTAGRFDEARAAFQQVLVLNPNHPHVAGRLAAVEEQRQAAGATTRLRSSR